jgi:hypothetical protein
LINFVYRNPVIPLYQEDVIVSGARRTTERASLQLMVEGSSPNASDQNVNLLEVVFPIDSSGSMLKNEAAKSLLSKLNPDTDQGTVVDRDEKAIRYSNWTFEGLKEIINGVDSVGASNISNGLRSSIGMPFSNVTDSKAIILFYGWDIFG